MDDASQTYINSRDGIPAFANWCKKEIAANDITINNVEYPDIRIEEFQNPNFDAEISCLPTCLCDGLSPKYQSIKAGNYLMSRFHSAIE